VEGPPRVVERAGESVRRHAVAARPAFPTTPLPLSNRMPPPERVFTMLVRDGDVASASNYLAVRSRLRAVGKYVAIYVDTNDGGGVGQDLLSEIVSTFDSQILPTVARLWGPAQDVDRDGRFTVFLTRRLSHLGDGRLAADGFVRGADFDPELSAPFGNHCDMMYLNASMRPGPHLRTVLAHEYTHAVIFSRKALGRDGARVGAEEEGWLDEALAHLAEDLFAFSRSNLDYRIAAYLAAPERYRLIVNDYYAANLFRSHGHRGGAYLFLRWCADQHGPDLISTLIRSPRRGIPSLEAATGCSFEDLFRRWTIDLAREGIDQAPSPEARDRRRRDEYLEMAGPRSTRMTPGDQHEWSTSGTAPHFVSLGPSKTGQTLVDVEGPPAANIQVTAIPLPDDLPRLELSVTTVTGPQGDTGVAISVRESDGAAVRLLKLSWGPLVPSATKRGTGEGEPGWDGANLSSVFGKVDLAPRERVVSRAISPKGLFDDQGKAVMKLVGSDAKGRRVVAWATVERPAE
jgi:hypothetical protein